MKIFAIVVLTTTLLGAAWARTHAPLDVAESRAAELAPINPADAALVLLTCNENVIGGQILACEAWLTASPGKDALLDVVLLGTDPNVAAAPTQVVLPAGRRKQVIPVVTRPVNKPTALTLRVSYRGESLAATRMIMPPTLQDIRLTHSHVFGGAPTSLHVTLTGPAPTGGLSISLKSSHENILPVPDPLVVPAHARFLTVELPTRPVERATTVMLSATVDTDPQARSLPVHIAGKAPADLTIASWSYRDAAGPLPELPRGRPFELCVEIVNRSYGKAPPSRARLILFTSSGQDLALEAKVPSLAAGESAQPCFPMPALDPNLQYSFNIYADYGNALAEGDEGNNVTTFEPGTSEPTPAPAPAARPAPTSEPI